MMISLPSLGLTALLLAAHAAPPASTELALISVEKGVELRWDDLELPAGFFLDLETGVVSSHSAEGRPTLTFAAGWLSSKVPLRALPWRDGAPLGRVARDFGEPVSGVGAEVGRELIFDLHGESWGYLRIVEVRPERVRLEFVFEPDVERRELRRDPPELNARSGSGGVHLSWPAVPGAEYRVDRRSVPQVQSRERSEWTELTRTSADSWFDERASGSQLVEYRVCEVHGGFGSRARGVGDFVPSGELLRASSNQAVNLLNGKTDEERADLSIEFVRSTGVQVLPSSGAIGRVLTPSEAEGWDLPELLEGGSPRQRFFLSPGRVFAIKLAEGAYARLLLVSIEGGEATFERRINLDGSRTFPPAPQVDEILWESARGVLLHFAEDGDHPSLDCSEIVVEREGVDGLWSECARGPAGVLELVDSTPTEELLVRYRFSRSLDGSAISPTSEPASVLIGDDGGAGTEVLLERALVELGADDYARRSRAREVLIALGERAWPALREALRSSNIELAEAARELLMRDATRTHEPASSDGSDLAGLLLGVRAEQLGAGGPPHSDWTSASPTLRASAALRGAGWREVAAERTGLWRRVLAEADPDESVRLAATMAGALQREGLGPDLRQAAPGSAPWRAAAIDAPTQPHPSTREALEGTSAWALLAALQSWHGLAQAASQGGEAHDHALERYDLTQALITQYQRGADELFLESALRVSIDPLTRLRAVQDLMSMQQRQAEHDSGQARVVRLESPDTELLAAELSELKRDATQSLLIVLPAGVYEALPGGRQLVAEQGQVTLRADGEVLIRSGFTLMDGCTALLEGLTISPASGIALNLVKSNARLEDCTMNFQSVGVMGTDSTLELIHTALLPAEGARSDAAGVRLSGRSMLLASESRIEALGIAVYGARATLFDSCVVVSRSRNAVEGNGEGEVWAVASMLSGSNLALARVQGGLLDGVVLLGGANKVLQAGDELKLCADHLWQKGDLRDVEKTRWTDACVLHR